MDYTKIMSQALKEASRGYAEKIARENRVRAMHAPGLDYGVRQLVFGLVNSGVVDAEAMYSFLDKNRYRDNTPENWWND